MRWWKPRKSNPSAPLVGGSTILVFSGCKRSPRSARTVRRQLAGPLRPVRGWRTGRRSRRSICTSIPNRLSRRRPRLIEHVQSDVGQQRRDRRALRGARPRFGDDPALEDPRPQPTPQQLHHPPVDHPPLDLGDQRVVVDLVEAALMSASSTHVLPRWPSVRTASQGLVGRALRAGTRSWSGGSRPRRSVRARSSPPPSPPGRPPWGCRAAGSAPAGPAWGYAPAATAAADTSRPAARRRARRGTRRTPEPSIASHGHAIDAGGALVSTHVAPRPSTSRRCGRPCRTGRGTDDPGPAWHCGRARAGGHERGPRPSARLTDLAEVSALIRAPPILLRASMKQGPFAPAGLCCPARHHYYDPLRLPLGRLPLPGFAGYRQARSRPPQATGPRRASPVPRTTIRRSTPPTPEGSSAPAPGSQTPSMAFAVAATGSAPSFPAHTGERLTTLQASLDAADRHESLHPASHAGLSTDARGHHYRGPWHLPGPDSHRQAVLSLSLGYVMRLSPSSRRPSCWTHSRATA